jgi:hypothetical protein
MPEGRLRRNWHRPRVISRSGKPTPAAHLDDEMSLPEGSAAGELEASAFGRV